MSAPASAGFLPPTASQPQGASALGGFRSHLPLRGSPGFTPGSLLSRGGLASIGTSMRATYCGAGQAVNRHLVVAEEDLPRRSRRGRPATEDQPRRLWHGGPASEDQPRVQPSTISSGEPAARKSTAVDQPPRIFCTARATPVMLSPAMRPAARTMRNFALQLGANFPATMAAIAPMNMEIAL